MIRATRDKDVIARWGIRRRNHLLYFGIAYAVLGILAVILLLLADHSFLPLVPIAGFVLVYGLSLVSLKCPNCSQLPGYVVTRPHSSVIDYCRHCHYWLNDPASDHDPHTV